MADSFPCDCCGICCETLIRLDVYNDLDDGTGHCRYYDRISHLCTIYEHRPEKCNVMALHIFQDYHSHGAVHQELFRRTLFRLFRQ